MPRVHANQRQLTKAQKAVVATTCYIVQAVALAVAIYANPLYSKQDYHTSALTGAAWVDELIHGHPDRIRSELGVRLHVYLLLVEELRAHSGLTDSKYVTLREQVAIFLYMSVTGLSIRHVGERFQRSNETISKYYRKVLNALSSPPFYTKFVHLPSADSIVPDFIRNNPKFYPYFEGALGAMDGTHINCCPNLAERQTARNRKGGVTQNCLAICSFCMRFLFFVSGWDGCTADAEMYEKARLRNLRIPDGRFYLADAGFGICHSLLVPFRGVRYHLAEWGRAGIRPETPEELYNLRHASARNVVERIFGVLKKRFDILTRPPHFSLDIQARVPPALAAVHNFIRDHDDDDIQDFEGDVDEEPGLMPNRELDFGVLTQGPASNAEKAEAAQQRNEIAQAMWVDYQQLIQERAGDILE